MVCLFIFELIFLLVQTPTLSLHAMESEGQGWNKMKLDMKNAFAVTLLNLHSPVKHICLQIFQVELVQLVDQLSLTCWELWY